LRGRYCFHPLLFGDDDALGHTTHVTLNEVKLCVVTKQARRQQ
jgi:hypothetical protein